ncbi:FG-GAP repeat domain-containing protein [Paludisphaera soli]|uniref:FG-GAP repeat domain-containing protein n=1 Tax=Paludisphaera soli TaxID=2712865 RepID=UPI0013EB06DF|nr:VCBS repeat-containing protein [Paludisphaera soli]
MRTPHRKDATKLGLALLLLGGLAPTIRAQTFHATSSGPYFVSASDLDGDGAPDAILPCRGELLPPTEPRPGNDVLTVLLTEGSAEPRVRRDFPVGFGPYTAIPADLDGDGRLDVAVVNFQANDGRDLSILWGEDPPSLLKAAEHVRIEGGPFRYEKSFAGDGAPAYAAPGLTSIVATDVDRDGRLDLVAVAWSSDFFVVLRNRGDRTFAQHRRDLMPGPRDVVAADFSGDGVADLAFTIYSSNLVEVWRGDGEGDFARWRMFHSNGAVPYHLRSGDVDRDGRVDLVVGNRGVSDNVAVFLNAPEGFRFAGSYTPGTPKTGEATADEIRDVLLYDEDGDGVLDLAAACHLSHKLVRWRGSGDPAFGAGFVDRDVVEFPGRGPRSLVALPGGLGVAFYDVSKFAVVPHRPDAAR